MLFFTSATRKHPSAQREGSSSAGRVLPHAIGHPSVCITNSAGTCPEHPFSAPCAPSWRIEAISHSLLWAAQPPDSEVNAEQNGAAPLGAAFHIPIQRSVCGKKVASLGWREGGWQARGNQKQGREELEEGNRSRRWQLKQKLGMGGSNKQWHTAADLNQRGTGALFCAHPPRGPTAHFKSQESPLGTWDSFQESRVTLLCCQWKPALTRTRAFVTPFPWQTLRALQRATRLLEWVAGVCPNRSGARSRTDLTQAVILFHLAVKVFFHEHSGQGEKICRMVKSGTLNAIS